MTDQRITDLADGSYVQSTDEFVVARAGANYKIAGSKAVGPVKIFDSILGVDTASIDTGAGAIPAGFGAIEIVTVLRTDEAAAISNALLRFNNDSGLNYDSEDVAANSTGAPSSENTLAGSSLLVIVHGSGGSASYASGARILVASYDQTTFFKTALWTDIANDATAGNNWCRAKGGTWRSASAITRVSIAAAGTGKLKAGSRLLIYGLP